MDSNYKYDILKMYFGEDYSPTDGIVVKQPTIQDIIDYGESEFWHLAFTLCANPTSLRLLLWQSGIDWNDVDDFDLFSTLISDLSCDKTKLLFGNLDFSKFKRVTTSETESVLVYMPNPSIQIDRDAYDRLVGYLRTMFNIHPKVEKAKNKSTKEFIILEEEMNVKNTLQEEENELWKKSTLFPLISSALNHPGFKYTKNELRDIGIVEFMDSVKRLQLYESVTSLMTGMYMGMIDTKSLDMQKELNWTRDLYKD